MSPRFQAIGAVGLYVPGGTAVLPSTALMLAIAKIAGCARWCSPPPPRAAGGAEVLYVAKKAGVTHILRAGGAQAVAAMGHGTQTCPKVDKIFGPGNQFVTAAKMTLQNSEAMCAIDMLRGPVWCWSSRTRTRPRTTSPRICCPRPSTARTLQVVLVVTPDVDLDAIVAAVARQAKALPRSEITAKALGHSYAVVVKDWRRRARSATRTRPST